MNDQLTKLGTFALESGLLLASDPCYAREEKSGAQLKRVFAAEIGVWNSVIAMTEDDLRIKQLIAWHWHHSLPGELHWDRVDTRFGVDTGVFGFFDFDKIRYHGSLEMVYDATRDGRGGVLRNGCAVRSGFGDGLYGVDIRKNGFGLITAIRCTFIEEGDNE